MTDSAQDHHLIAAHTPGRRAARGALSAPGGAADKSTRWQSLVARTVLLCSTLVPMAALTNLSSASAADRTTMTGRVRAVRVQAAAANSDLVVLRHARVVGPLQVGPEASLTARDTTFLGPVHVVWGGSQHVSFTHARFRGQVELDEVEVLSPLCFGCRLTVSSSSFAAPLQVLGRTSSGMVGITKSTFHQPVHLVAIKSLAIADSKFASQLQVTDSQLTNLSFNALSAADIVDASKNEIERLSIQTTSAAQGIDLSDSVIGTFSVACVRGRPVYISWSQFGSDWIKHLKAIGTGDD
jgi:hypothetical protein